MTLWTLCWSQIFNALSPNFVILYNNNGLKLEYSLILLNSKWKTEYKVGQDKLKRQIKLTEKKIFVFSEMKL